MNDVSKLTCYSCGAEDPNYSIEEYQRVCEECGEPSVMTVEEVIDLLNDLRLKGLIKDAIMAEHIAEDYGLPELDFEEDSGDIERSFKVFREDLKEEYGEDYD
jgi:hypothetical protein